MKPRIACIDLGNSRTHLGLVQDGQVLTQTNTNTATCEWEIRQWLDELQFDGVAWCSVVPAKNAAVSAETAAYSKPAFQLSHEDAPGLPITYPRPAEVGQDRLANAIAAQALNSTPAIILDAGTAVTCDIVLPEGGYIGGLIAPGLAMLTDYLHDKTAQLPKVPLENLSPKVPFGQSTADSMALACAVGFDGMIAAITERAIEECVKRGYPGPAMLATGGSFLHLVQERSRWQWIPGLTLLGLAEAWTRKWNN